MKDELKFMSLIVLALIVVFTGLDVGCYIANVLPIKAGGCVRTTEIGVITTPCPK